MKPKYAGNVPPSPSERLMDKVPSSTPKAAPGGIQPPKHAYQEKMGFKCFDSRHSHRGGGKHSY